MPTVPTALFSRHGTISSAPSRERCGLGHSLGRWATCGLPVRRQPAFVCKRPVKDLHNISPAISELFRKFETMSGLRVNWSKSGVYSFNNDVAETDIIISETVLTWYPTTIRYLGIYIYRSPIDILDGNLVWAISSVKAQIQFWKTLPLNVMSRVTLIKMIILLRLLYYFSNLPVYVPVKLFRDLEGLFRDLIWNKGRPRIALQKLYAPTEKGVWQFRTLNSIT